MNRDMKKGLATEIQRTLKDQTCQFDECKRSGLVQDDSRVLKIVVSQRGAKIRNGPTQSTYVVYSGKTFELDNPLEIEVIDKNILKIVDEQSQEKLI